VKFTLNRKQFLAELDFIKPILPRSQKDGDGVAGWLRVVAAADGITFTATNRQAIFETVVKPVGDVSPGRVNISPFVIDPLTRLVTDNEVHFEAVATGLEMRWSTGYVRIREASTPMPTLPSSDITSTVTLPKTAIEACLQRVKAFLPYKFDARVPGVLIEAGDALRVVAIADGAAMAVVTQDAKSSHPCNILLPTGGIERLLWAMRSNAVEEVSLLFSNAIQIKCGHRTATTTRASGVMPPWERMLFKDHVLRADFPVDVATEAIRRAAMPDDRGCGAVGLRLTPGSLTVFSSETTESFAAAYDGAPTEAVFNSKYLLGLLEPMQSSRVEMRAKGNVFIFQPLGSTQDQYVLATMRPRP
jgi:DNA polymerase III sliding clamp (beta) subunit (PCNA family)